MKKTIVFLFLMFVSLQSFSQGLKIVTGHPDFKVKITRCEANGSTAVIDMVIENAGNNDVLITMWGGRSCWGTPHDMSVAYDDEGNKYTGENDFKVSIGKSGLSKCFGVEEVIPSDIPLKARIQLEGVPESANEFRRIDLIIDSEAWGLNDKKPVKFTNVPISRDGDD